MFVIIHTGSSVSGGNIFTTYGKVTFYVVCPC